MTKEYCNFDKCENFMPNTQKKKENAAAPLKKRKRREDRRRQPITQYQQLMQLPSLTRDQEKQASQ